jgi:hypothetical protein
METKRASRNRLALFSAVKPGAPGPDFRTWDSTISQPQQPDEQQQPPGFSARINALMNLPSICAAKASTSIPAATRKLRESATE